MELHEQMRLCIQSANEWTQGKSRAAFGNDSPDSRRIKRLFGLNQTAELVGVTRQAIADAEESGRLPAPRLKDTKGKLKKAIRAGYTLEDHDHMRDEFGTQPYRPDGTNPVVISVPGGKGGCYKTSVVAHIAQWLSMRGYRVLVIDIDPQAHLSMYFGYHPELNTTINDTVLPWMLGNADDLTYAINGTAWPKLDIIPSHLHMQRLESELREADTDYEVHQMLQAGIQSVSDSYDVVLIDGHPDLGLGTMNMICASDIALLATSTEVNDINSSCQLMGLIADLYDPESGLEHSHTPIVRVLPTKIGSPTSSSHENLREMHQFWGGVPTKNCVRVTDEVGKGQRRMATIFEQADDKDVRSSPSAWKRATEIFDAIFTEIHDELIVPHWRER